MVSAATMPDAVAEPRTPNRSAAQMMRGKMAYSSPVRGRSNAAVRPSRLTSSTPASATLAGGHRVRGACAQARSRGAISRSPIASPDHQTNQRCPVAARSIIPLVHGPSPPRVALTGGLTSAASVTSARKSRSPAREGWKSATRWSSRTAVTASRVFPAAMPAAAAAGTPLVQLSRKAPSAMPGQKRTPNRRSGAHATPAGGPGGGAAAAVVAGNDGGGREGMSGAGGGPPRGPRHGPGGGGRAGWAPPPRARGGCGAPPPPRPPHQGRSGAGGPPLYRGGGGGRGR